MGYLILALCSSAMVSVVMRLSDGKVNNNLGMLVMNYLMCTLLGGASTGFAFGPDDRFWLTGVMGTVNGVLYLVSFVLFQMNVQRNGVVLSATFMKLGLLVTMVISVCFYGEIPGVLQTLGFALAVAAIVLIHYRKEAGSAGFKAGLPLLLLCGGMADAMSKIFEESGAAGMGNEFLLFTFAVALVLCFFYMRAKGQRIAKQEIVYGLLIGIPNFYSSKFLLWALVDVPAVIAYPVYSVGTILAVTLAGVALFRERLEKRQWLALGMILTALVFLNI
jgi:drug/metabolite transporter (DMT)-like permease